MDLQSKNNAREALNNLKMEISSELGYPNRGQGLRALSKGTGKQSGAGF